MFPENAGALPGKHFREMPVDFPKMVMLSENTGAFSGMQGKHFVRIFAKARGCFREMPRHFPKTLTVREMPRIYTTYVLNRIPPKIPRRASRAGFPLYPLCMFNRIPLKTFPVRNKTPENPRRASRAGFPLYSLCILSRVPLKFSRRAKRAGIFRNITNSGKCSGIHRKFFPGNAPAFSENVNIFRKCPVNSYMNF